MKTLGGTYKARVPNKGVETIDEPHKLNTSSLIRNDPWSMKPDATNKLWLLTISPSPRMVISGTMHQVHC